MSVKFEVKGMLARLLATEDIVVEHKKVETACFNVHTRVLTLPMWERASNTVYDLLVGHEVGHALYTPDENWKLEVNIPHQFMNVVEDARIEKLMKRRYAGLAKTFYGGYKELSEQDFFAIGDDDISTYNLADRANLLFKIGNYVNVPILNSEESDIIDLISSAETFKDALIAAEALYKYCKKNQKKHKETSTPLVDFDGDQSSFVFSEDEDEEEMDIEDYDSDEDDSDEDDSDEDDSEVDDFSTDDSILDSILDETEDEESEDSEEDEEDEEEDSNDNSGGTTGSNEEDDESEDEEPEVKTAEQLAESIRDLVNINGIENVYIEIPELDLEKIIVPNSEIHKNCEEQWNSAYKNGLYSKEEIFRFPDERYKNFKRSAQKEVNYLVKEFECRKAADSYARATTARTGVLDCTKLHTYKFNDDLFKKVTMLADGKNHGLVFILDWSGSMSRVMEDTIKQLYNLIWFCRKVSIPFEVYAFTNDYPYATRDNLGKKVYRQLAYKKRDGIFHIPESFSLMNILSSKVKNYQLEQQMLNIFRVVYALRCRTSYVVPLGMDLSGTPLNQSLVALHQILPKFQNEHKLQKVHCVILTDGESASIGYHRQIQRRWEQEPFIGTAWIGSNCFLRDRKTGNIYLLDTINYKFTDTLIHNLRDKFSNINFIGIRVLGKGSANEFIRQYCGYYGDEFDRVSTSWKKEKAFSIKNSGYHTYFGISSSSLSQDTEFDVDENATKNQIKSSFMKKLKGKKMNKKILGDFIDLIA